MAGNGGSTLRRRLPGITLMAFLTVLALSGCKRSQPEVQPEAAAWPEIAMYEPMRIPEENPMTPAKVELGKQLYYDARVSGDESRSCYACHLEEHGLTDGRPTAIGAWNVQLTRKSPTMWNLGYHREWYWDGRAKTLEGQAKAAWVGGNMGASGKDGRPGPEEVCARLEQAEGYRRQFQEVFGQGCTADNVPMALAAFMRTIVSTAERAAWIRFRAGDESALDEQARRGWQLFSGKAGCTNCHDGVLLTDLQYHNVGIGMKAKDPDLGRYAVTKDEKDRGAFKTPTLLDISKRAPHFHDGSAATLEDAVDLMLGGGIPNPYLDVVNLKPVKLTPDERSDLLHFLRALDVEYRIRPPKLPE